MHGDGPGLNSFEHPTGFVDLTAQVRTATIRARVKVLNPLTSNGPPMFAEVLGSSPAGLRIRVPRRILVGSTVQIRTGEKFVLGTVHASASTGAEFEIEVVAAPDAR